MVVSLAAASVGSSIAGSKSTGAILSSAFTAAQAIGAGLSGIGAIRSGQAAGQQSRFQSEVLRQQADRERKIAAQDETDFRRRISRLQSRNRALFGARGVQGGTGSPLLVSEDLAGEAEFQSLRIRSGGENIVTRLEQQSGIRSISGRNARRAGFIRGGSLLLSGLGRTFA